MYLSQFILSFDLTPKIVPQKVPQIVPQVVRQIILQIVPKKSLKSGTKYWADYLKGQKKERYERKMKKQNVLHIYKSAACHYNCHALLLKAIFCWHYAHVAKMCLDLSKSEESSDKELSNFGFEVGFVQFHTKGQLISNAKPNNIFFWFLP